MINLFMIIAVICAYIVKGMCGFANTIVFSTIMSFQKNNIEITPVDLLVGLPSNILIAVKEHKSIKLNVWLPLAIMVVIGSIPGILFLKIGNVTLLKIIFGFVIVFIGIEMLCREYQTKTSKSSKVLLLIIGIISGFISGLFGIGALLAAYIGRTTTESSSFRGNLCMVFIVDNIFRLIVYIFAGIMTISVVKQALILVPFMIIGLGSGMLLSKILDEKIMKKIIIVMLVISGISLIITNMI